MKITFDFVVHWLWTILFSILALTGLAMVGAKYSWILNYDISTADYYHRISAALFVLLTLVSIVFDALRHLRACADEGNQKKLVWFVIGKDGYGFFTFITTLIFIITGAIIWVCMDTNMAAFSFALFIHEKLTYIAVASVIWHIYKKCHALLWPKKPVPAPPKAATAVPAAKGGKAKNDAKTVV